MSLPTPRLDDRTAQQLVDEAKRMITHFCPEWTDHNVSDPGVALIELFAWMTELLLYRVNQVPDRVYIKFIEMLGKQLDPPHPAHVRVTFHLGKPLADPNEADVVVWGDDQQAQEHEPTEVATVRSDVSPPIVFTVEKTLALRAPSILHALTMRRPGWVVAYNTSRLHSISKDLPLVVFPEEPEPQPGDALYFQLERDHSNNILALIVSCTTAGPTGVDRNNVPWHWEVAQGGGQWAPCIVLEDSTGGFTQSGTVVLELPMMRPGAIQIQQIDPSMGFAASMIVPFEPELMEGFWLRCVVGEPRPRSKYESTPRLTSLRVEVRGGTAPTKNATIVRQELLGRSSGAAGQTFKLQHGQVLPLNAEREHLIVEAPDGTPEQWTYVSDFATSGKDDKVFTLDYLSGTLTLGPALRQPDGSVYQFSAVPPIDSTLYMSRYQYGGGSGGNVPANALTVLRTAIPRVTKVENREPATSGLDAETPEIKRLKAPEWLRTRTRAVTASDYEFLACEVPEVARARCVHPGQQPPNVRRGEEAAALQPPLGHVWVAVLPHSDTITELYEINRLLDHVHDVSGIAQPPVMNRAMIKTIIEQRLVSAEQLDSPRIEQMARLSRVLEDVGDMLNERRPLGIRLDVRLVRFQPVAVTVVLRMRDMRRETEAQQRAKAEIKQYVSPYHGGPIGQGWPFGRTLYASELAGHLQHIRLPGVEFVEQVQLSGTSSVATTTRVDVPADSVIYLTNVDVQTEPT